MDEYGITPQTVICSNFLKAWKTGRGFARAVLLHGPEGCGKTTLVELLARHYGWPLIQTNASLSHSKEFLDKLWAASRTMALGSERKILFFDEIDSLTATQQTQLIEIIRGAGDPIFLACNDFSEIKDDLKKTCLCVEISHPDKPALRRVAEHHGVSLERLHGARSYRDVETILGGGDIARREDVDSVKRAKAILRGEIDPRPSEYWMLGSWVMDNCGDGPIGQYYDRAYARYRKVGKSAEKYLRFVLKVAPSAEPQFPWSVSHRNSLRKPAPSAAKAREAPEPTKEPKGRSKAPVATEDATSFF